MVKARLSIWVLVLVAGAAAAGCKKDPDQALVVFTVQVNSDVQPIGAIEFSVDNHPDAGKKQTINHDDGASFRFGYYMPALSGTITIRGQARDRTGCVIGEGTLPANGAGAGATVTLPESMPLVIAKLAVPACGQDGGMDAAPLDAPTMIDGGKDATGGDRIDKPPPDSGGGGDGPKLALGQACAAGGDCVSNDCVDGVCCESACTGSCEACAELNTKGSCVAMTGTPRPGHMACAGTGPCAGTCDGASRTVCSYPGAMQPCGAASCTNNIATLPAVCDGKGACGNAQTVDCSPNSCVGTICAGGCSTTQPCSATTYCSAAGKCLAKKANGQACAVADECTSGACADGVCCNIACTAACMACNLPASPGTCAAVKSGIDDACSGAQICDAMGACKKSNGSTCNAATECASAACVDGHCCGSAACGTCQACTGGGGICVAVTSADDADTCMGANTCDALGACKAKASQACTTGTQCVTGFCADGVCCNNACTGQCEACGESATKGTCTAVSAAPRTGHAACAGTGTSCGGTCDGTTRTACNYPGNTTSCRSASCTASTATLAATCNGAGACPAVQTVSCAPNTCAGTVCAGGCSATQPCAGNNYCSGGTCVPKKGNGIACGTAVECTSAACIDGFCCGSTSCAACQACTGAGGTCVAITNAEDPDSCTGTSSCDVTGTCKKKTGQTCSAGSQCVSNNCVDGVCCNTACSGSCEFCNGGSPGTCGFITGPPKAGHAACAGAGNCQGTCNGTRSTCSLPGAETTCRQPTCSNGSATNAAVCDGNGNCPLSTTIMCGQYVCNGNTSCFNTCSSPAQCVAGDICSGGSCQSCNGLTACTSVCANLTSDPGHCGSCTTSCSGPTPFCSNRSCVQCRTLSDCAGGYSSCSSGSCLCRQKSVGNILINPGFETDLSGWSVNDAVTAKFWNAADADGCPKSGSLMVNGGQGDVSQCRPATPNTQYFVGLRFKQSSGGAFTCFVSFFQDTACTDQPDSTSNVTLRDDSTVSANWTNLSSVALSPSFAASVQFLCGSAGMANLDQLYINLNGSF